MGIREVGSERPNVMRLLLLGLGIAAACLAAGAGDVDRIQGVITELHPQGFILATEGRTVVVDMSALGGITMALARGQAIVAIGTLAPNGKTFHAVRLEPPAVRTQPTAKPSSLLRPPRTPAPLR